MTHTYDDVNRLLSILKAEGLIQVEYYHIGLSPEQRLERIFTHDFPLSSLGSRIERIISKWRLEIGK